MSSRNKQSNDTVNADTMQNFKRMYDNTQFKRGGPTSMTGFIFWLFNWLYHTSLSLLFSCFIIYLTQTMHEIMFIPETMVCSPHVCQMRWLTSKFFESTGKMVILHYFDLQSIITYINCSWEFLGWVRFCHIFSLKFKALFTFV